jgi:hypothetical protein
MRPGFAGSQRAVTDRAKNVRNLIRQSLHVVRRRYGARRRGRSRYESLRVVTSRRVTTPPRARERELGGVGRAQAEGRARTGVGIHQLS